MTDTERPNWLEQQVWFRNAVADNMYWDAKDDVRQAIDREIEREKWERLDADADGDL